MLVFPWRCTYVNADVQKHAYIGFAFEWCLILTGNCFLLFYHLIAPGNVFDPRNQWKRSSYLFSKWKRVLKKSDHERDRIGDWHPNFDVVLHIQWENIFSNKMWKKTCHHYLRHNWFEQYYLTILIDQTAYRMWIREHQLLF